MRIEKVNAMRSALTIKRYRLLLAAIALTVAAVAGLAGDKADRSHATPMSNPYLYAVEQMEEFEDARLFQSVSIYCSMMRGKGRNLSFVLGCLYWYGIGVERDCAKAEANIRDALFRGRDGIASSYRGWDVDVLTVLSDIRAAAPCGGDKFEGPAAADLSPEEAFRWAMRHELGICAPTDYARSMEYLVSAAERGHEEARVEAAARYLYGSMGVTKDCAAARKWLEPAAEAGDGRALAFVGKLHRDGCGVDNDPTLAASYFQQAIEAGYGQANSNLADLYSKGEGVEKNEATADSLREKGKECYRNHIAALNAEGMRAYRGDGEAVDYFKAAWCFRRAFNFQEPNADDDECMYALGRIQEDGIDGVSNQYAAAIAFGIAAKNGHGPSMMRLGAMLEEGRGVRQSSRMAAKWYTKALEMGEADAEEALERAERAIAEGNGDGWLASPAMANMMADMRCRAFITEKYGELNGENAPALFAELARLADGGSTMAQLQVGVALIRGERKIGVEPDPEKGLKYLEAAAEAHSFVTAELLKELYARGDVVPRDLKKAAHFEEIANQGKRLVAELEKEKEKLEAE